MYIINIFYIFIIQVVFIYIDRKNPGIFQYKFNLRIRIYILNFG